MASSKAKADKRLRRQFDDVYKRAQVKRFIDERKKNGITFAAYAAHIDVGKTVFRNWVDHFGKEWGFRLPGRTPAAEEAAPIAPAGQAPAEEAPESSRAALDDEMAPSGDWASEEGAQLRLAMGVESEADGSEPEEKDETLLSRPEPPPSRRRRSPGIVRVAAPSPSPFPEAFAEREPSASGGNATEGTPEFVRKVTTEVMADNAALIRVMKIMMREQPGGR